MNSLDNTQANFLTIKCELFKKGFTKEDFLKITKLSSKGLERYLGMGYLKKTQAGKDAYIVPYAAFKRAYDFWVKHG